LHAWCGIVSANVTTGSSEITEHPQSQAPAPTNPGRARRQNWWIFLLLMAVLGAVGLLLTLVWFINPTTQEVEAVQPADAVVLFAGTSERFDTAVELMDRGAAPNLVLVNGNTLEGESEDLCESAPYQVFCPDSRTVDTVGEAETIGQLAREQGWSNLIAVTSTYHVHRATSLLGRCFDGSIQVVTPDQGLDREELIGKVPHEWVGFLASFVFGPSC
jgi:uncharacterized SAM-binding protein YcdF (DUF218 family)